ncbi:MAG: hypothetical protein ACYC9Y_02785 [Candidatus Methylomirabilia bacterium]
MFVSDLDRLPSSGEPYDRLYLGSEFCVWRLPTERELHGGREVAARRGISFSLVTPFLDEPGLRRTLALVRALPEETSFEVVANDLGLIEALRDAGWGGTLVAGRLLTRQRRGPGFQSFGEVPPEAAAALRGSALDSPAFVDLLGSVYGVKRFELDDLVQGVLVPALPAGVRLSLYRPYLLVTATRNCPWIFDGGTWDREHGCPRPCRGQALRLMSAAEQAPAAVQKSELIDHGEGEGVTRRGGLRRADRREHDGGQQRQDPEACTDDGPASGRTLVLGGCAQFLEHRSDEPPPAGVDRIVWQPDIPA